MWFVIGIIASAILISSIWWLNMKNITPRWYEWLIGGIGFVLFFYAIQNTLGFLREIEPTAAGFTAAFFGIPALILVAVAFRLVFERRKNV